MRRRGDQHERREARQRELALEEPEQPPADPDVPRSSTDAADGDISEYSEVEMVERLKTEGNPRAILGLLTNGDPLNLVERCIERLRARALLLNSKILYARSLARVAHDVVIYAGDPTIPAWINERIDTVIESLIREDREAERDSLPPPHPLEPRFAFMSEAFGLEPGLARQSIVAFNDLQEDVRRAFYTVAIEAKSVNRYVAEGSGPPTHVHDLLKIAVEAIARPGDPWDLAGEGGQV